MVHWIVDLVAAPITAPTFALYNMGRLHTPDAFAYLVETAVVQSLK